MKVMIVEPRAGGHTMILYVRSIARAAIRRGWQLQILTTRAAMSHPAYETVCAECGRSVQTFLMPPVSFPTDRPTTWQLLKHQLLQHAALSSAYRNVKSQDRPDVICMTSLDLSDKAMALVGSPFGHTPFVGIQMSIRFHHRRMGVMDPGSRSDFLHEWLFRRLLGIPTLQNVVTIDEPFSHYVRRVSWMLQDKVRYIPDAAALSKRDITYEQAGSALGIGADGVVVLVYGVLDERKGLVQLLHALADNACPHNVIVLLAGQQDYATDELLDLPVNVRLRDSGRIVEMSGFLDDDQEYRAFRAADIVWLGYRGFFGMSGVLVSAASLGLPVIACRDGVIGWMTGKYGLGDIVDTGNEQQILQSISRLAADVQLRSTYARNGLAMAPSHTGEHFGEAICSVLAGE